MNKKRMWLAAGTVLAALSTGLAVGAQAQAIGGSGSAAPDDSYRFAAKIAVGGVRNCSGALVTPQWIVTSSVCFAEDGKPVSMGVPSRTATVSVGHGTAVAQTTTVGFLVPHADRNVVLAKLATRISGIEPVPVGTAPPAIGDVLRAAGYGRTATEWVPAKLHAAPFKVTGVRAGALDVTGVDAAAGICKGDSGGPLLQESGGRVALVAIHHTAGQKGCVYSSDTDQDAIETRLDDLGEWITQNTTDALQSSVRFGSVTGVAGKCLDIKDTATANGTAVQLVTCKGVSAQEVTAPGDGTLRVLGKCVDSGGPATGDPGDQMLHLWRCNGTGPQQWEQRPNGTIYQTLTGRCIDAPSSNDGARLYTHACHTGDNQKWAVPASSGARFGRLVGVGGKCLDISDGSYTNGTTVQLLTCSTTSAAQEVTLPGDGTLRVLGKCVDAGGPKVGTEDTPAPKQLVHLWGCNKTAPQQWLPRPDNTVLNGLSGAAANAKSCLDARGTSDRSQLYIHPCNGGPNQLWKLP